VTGRFDAVVFDLFGTLVPEFSKTDFYASVRRIAEVLGCDPVGFEAAWTATSLARQTGAYPDGVAGNVRDICRTLGVEVDQASLDEALRSRAELYRRWFHPREGALETLRALRERGVPTGLISMCAPDTPPMWRASELASLVDVTVFSSESGLRKPDAAIYLRCCEELDVKPEACLYCGDGAYAELTGAAAVGMTAYLIRPPNLDFSEVLTPEPEENWQGPAVADLRELLTFF
jgi:putative hydrolase of the HAD superfamily